MTESLRRISIIFRKDLKDAIRDARVLMAVLLPLGIGVLYNTIISDDVETPSVTVSYFAAGASDLPSQIQTSTGDAVDITFDEASSSDEVEQAISADDADVGLIIPDDFEAQVAAGNDPELDVLVGEDPGIGSQYVLSALDPIIRSMADQQFPANVQISTTPENLELQSAVERVGLRDYTVLFSLVLMLVMIGMLAIPIILTEENEKKTLDALMMVSSDREVLSAKAALGLCYMAITMTTLFLLIRRHPERVPFFIGSAVLLGIAVLGFGLLLATFLKNATQLNTWSGLIMFPVIAPAFAIGIGLSNRIETAAGLTPTGAGMTLFLDSWTSESLVGNDLRSVAVIIAWGLVAYTVALWLLRRRYA